MKDHGFLTPSQSSIVPPYTQYVRIVLGLKTTLLIYLKILMNKVSISIPIVVDFKYHQIPLAPDYCVQNWGSHRIKGHPRIS